MSIRKYIYERFKSDYLLRDGFRKIVYNFIWLLYDRIFRLGVGIIVGAWIARYLGPEQFGLLNYSQSLVFLFSAFSSLGIDSIAIREIVGGKYDKKELLGTVFVLKITGGIIVFIFSFISILLLRSHDDLTKYLVLIISLGYVFQAFNTIDLWFQSQLKAKYTVIALNATFIITTIVRIILIVNNAHLVAFAIMGVIDVVAGGIGLWITYGLKGDNITRWKFKTDIASSILKDSWPLILSGTSIAIYMRIDQIMIGHLLGDIQVGIYSVAVKLSELWWFIPMAISTSVYPKIVEAKKLSEPLYYKKIQKVFDAMSIVGYSFAIAITLLSGPIVYLLYGKQFQQASHILSIHVWAGLFATLGVAREVWLISENHTRFCLLATFLGAVSSITLNCIMITRYGGIGAAITVVISQVLSAYLSTLIISKKIFFCQTRALCLNFVRTLIIHR